MAHKIFYLQEVFHNTFCVLGIGGGSAARLYRMLRDCW